MDSSWCSKSLMAWLSGTSRTSSNSSLFGSMFGSSLSCSIFRTFIFDSATRLNTLFKEPILSVIIPRMRTVWPSRKSSFSTMRDMKLMSMFPPDSTVAAFLLSRLIAPFRYAVRPTHPAGSTTSFARSSR